MFTSAIINNKIHTSIIDHFTFCGPEITTFIINPKFPIFYDSANFSDHSTINLSFRILSQGSELERQEKTETIDHLDLKNPKISEFFKSQVDYLFYSSFGAIFESNFETHSMSQEAIDSM